MKRFYKEVSIGKDQGGFTILLDGRPIRCPSKAILIVPNEKLAELSRAEWDAQGEKIVPDSMPVTQFLNTRQDKILTGRTPLEKEMCRFINTDLLCYRADNPSELVDRQDKIWQPVLEAFEKRYGVKFQTTTGLGALKQDQPIQDTIVKEICALDADRFTLAQMVAPACGSLVLALAFVHDMIGVDDVMACAFLEEDYKFDLYNEALHGGDPLTEKKRKNLIRDLEAAEAYKRALD